MATMLSPNSSPASRLRHDAKSPPKIAPTPVVGESIPTIDLVLLTVSLTLLAAIFTFGIRI
jgi:hypothetical protein